MEPTWSRRGSGTIALGLDSRPLALHRDQSNGQRANVPNLWSKYRLTHPPQEKDAGPLSIYTYTQLQLIINSQARQEKNISLRLGLQREKDPAEQLPRNSKLRLASINVG